MFSGLIGPRIISNGLLYKYHFAVYGSLGKALLFGAISFLVLTYRRLKGLTLPDWHLENLRWLAVAILCFVGAWIGVGQLEQGNNTAYWAVSTHVLLISTILSALGACLGPASVRYIVRTFRRELLLTLALSAGFIVFLYAVYGLWQVLAASVLHSVHWLLGLTGLHSVIIPPRSLVFDKFGIEIAKTCSGIESIALFTGLYVVVGLLDWSRFRRERFLGIFLPALVVLFGFNILRVFVLILAGYYINPHIAFSLFHTYAGMVFFILYSGIFWYFAYGWMLKPVTSRDHQ